MSVESGLRRELLVKYALKVKLERIKADLERFGVKYDVWFSEQSLHDSGAVAGVVAELQEKAVCMKKTERFG